MLPTRNTIRHTGVLSQREPYGILKHEGRLPKVLWATKPRKPKAELVRERDKVGVPARRLRTEGRSLRQIGKYLSALGQGPPRGNRWFPLDDRSHDRIGDAAVRLNAGDGSQRCLRTLRLFLRHLKM